MAEQPETSKKPLTEDDIKEEPVSQGQNKAVKVILIVVGVLLLLGIIGTFALGWIGTRIGTTIFEQATNGSVDVDNGDVTFTGDDGDTEFRASQELPEDFPSEVPLYAGAELESSSRIRQNDEVYWSANYTTSDDYTTVSNYFEDIVDQGDWTKDSIFESGQMTNLSASNETAGLQLQLSVLADESAGTTAINYTVVRAQE